jgi:dihydropteroate synthase
VDILLWGQRELAHGRVRVPHPDILKRNFVLSPLVHLVPTLRLPGDSSGRTLLEHRRSLPHHIPLWMGILNVTPDSFSDGGRFTDWDGARRQVDRMRESGVNIIDVGAESTRPGATPLTAEKEWARLEPMLEHLLDHLGTDPLRPAVSVDTYHPEVAARSIDVGVDIINDVGGLQSAGMIELAAGTEATFIAMHNLGIPADRAKTLPVESDPVDVLRRWVGDSLAAWKRAGVSEARVVVDPGIGFGKDALQALHLLRHAGELADAGTRILVGHSRKSFMKAFAPGDEHVRDLVTTGASLNLCAQGVDFIRVHDVPTHTTAYRGWSHLVAGPLPPAERAPDAPADG